MAIIVGQCKVDPVTGAAGRAFAALQADADSGIPAGVFTATSAGPLLVQRKLLAAFITGIVGGTLTELTTNGVVTVSIPNTQGGLQTSAAVGLVTLPPVTTQTITGTVA